MPLALDGHNAAPDTETTTISATLTTTQPKDFIFAAILGNNTASITSVSDNSGQGLTWVPRSTFGVNSFFGVYYTFAPLAFTGVTITVNFSVAGTNGLVVWGVSGANIGQPFTVTPVGNFGGPQQLSTIVPNCFIYASARFVSTPNPTVGPGWTLVDSPSGNNQLVQYRIVTAPQVNLVGSVTTGNTDFGGEIIDAVDGPGSVFRLGGSNL